MFGAQMVMHDSRDSHRTICHQNITDQIFISLFDSPGDLDPNLGVPPSITVFIGHRKFCDHCDFVTTKSKILIFPCQVLIAAINN